VTQKDIAAEINAIQLDIDTIQGAIDALLDKIVGKSPKPEAPAKPKKKQGK
jgi:hypothetical protein